MTRESKRKSETCQKRVSCFLLLAQRRTYRITHTSKFLKPVKDNFEVFDQTVVCKGELSLRFTCNKILISNLYLNKSAHFVKPFSFSHCNIQISQHQYHHADKSNFIVSSSARRQRIHEVTPTLCEIWVRARSIGV